tara:strand:+ start:617 stop:856 length:240 start_codon:yes stop_codon:yes gene_type:complete
MKPGRPPTTDRSPARGGIAVRVNLSAEEHARFTAAAHPLTVAAWLRQLAQRATSPQMVIVDGGEPYLVPADGILRSAAR